MTANEPRRGQIPGRCGSCANFPGNGKKCTHEAFGKFPDYHRTVVYANDYGKGDCINFVDGVK